MESGGRARLNEDSSCSVRTVDAATAGVIMLLGGVVIYDSLRVGAAWEPNVGPQAGYFPFYIGLLMLVCSAVILYQALVSGRGAKAVFVRWGEFRQVLKVLVPSLVYALAVQFLGIYVASTLFIGGFMLWLGRYGIVPTLLVSLGVSMVMFWTFEVRFLIPLPKGPLEALLGY